MYLAFLFILYFIGLSHCLIPRACSTPETSKYPFCNNKLPLDQRINNLISLINLDEKPPLLTARMSPAGGIDRIGLPAYDWGANCIHGVQSNCGTECPTSFPTPCALGATFNMSLVKDMGTIIGVELRSLWLQAIHEHNGASPIGLDCWSPNININRDPRWGRNMEVPGEDPYLTGLFGIAYTKGIQEGQDARFLQGVSTLKHWAAYSLESYAGHTRFGFDAIVTPYDITNTYFPAWKASVVEGKAKGVMCAYDAVNGVPSCANRFLNDSLRGTFKFDGYVTSDTGAISCIVTDHKYVKTYEEAASAAITAGTDINSGGVYKDHLLNALTQGLIKEADIDKAIYNQFKIRFQLGLFDPIDDQPYWHVPPDAVNTKASQALNLLATQQSMVLLKNDKNTLPFKKGKNIAVLGPHGDATGALVGNYIGQICKSNKFECITSPFAAITQSNSGGHTVYFQGCTISGNSTTGFDDAINAAKASDYVVLILGIDQTIEREGKDRVSITLPGVQEKFAETIISVGKPTVIVLVNGGIVAIDKLKDSAPAILETFYPGFWGGVAISDVIFGDYNPGGKLPVTYYTSDYVNQVNFLSMNMTDAPGRSYRYYTGTPLWEFGFGLSYTTFKVDWTQNNNFKNPTVISNLDGDDVEVVYKVNVTNIGTVAGDEVVLAFYVPPKNTAVPLIKQLFGFQRVHLEPQQSVQLQFNINTNTLKLGDQDGNILSIPGYYEIQFTNGVNEIIKTNVLVVGKKRIIERYPF